MFKYNKYVEQKKTDKKETKERLDTKKQQRA